MIKAYYMLTKPGIILGNLITTAAGFALAARGHIDWGLLIATVIGLSFVIGSACVFNNIIDRDADAKMKRTQNRPLVKRVITEKKALFFAVFLGIMSIVVLALYTNLLTLFIAIGGFFFYVVMYSIWKYPSTYGTLVGSIAGAVPPVVGYSAVSNSFDMGAFLLFIILVFWQMPHFFAIAVYRLEEYKAASIPVLPLKKGLQATKIQMVAYIVAFMLAAVLLTFFGYTGLAYLSAATVLGIVWLWLGIKGFKSENDTVWARNMFRLSLVVVTLLSTMIIFDTR